MKRLFLRKKGKHERGGGAITALVIAFFICLNLMLVAVNASLEWFFSITDKQYYTLNGSTDGYFEKINPDNKKIDFYFCMSEDSLLENHTYGRILDTVKQFSERYGFFSLHHLDVYYDYDFIKNELGVEEEVTKDSVILHSPGVGHVVRSLSTFYIYDENDSTNDDMIFNGEEIVATLVRRVLGDKFPKVYFTVGHGETSTQSMQNLLFSAGYDVWTADISKNEIEEDCRLVVISNPLYDFEEFKDGSASEISRLRDFIARGGSVIVLRSPSASALPRLDAFSRAYGLSANVGSVLLDGENSIASNASALLLSYAEGNAAEAIARRASVAEGVGALAASGMTSLSLAEGAGYTAEPLLKTHASASLYTDGKAISSGEHTVAALSKIEGRNGSVGSLILVGGTGLADAMLLDMGSYGNESFLYSLLEYNDPSITAPIGAGVVVLNTYPLTNLSSNETRVLFVLLSVLVPTAAGACGFFVCRKRKNR